MAKVSLKDKIGQRLFLLDGAMGTQLIARGLEAGKCSDYANVESPDLIRSVHEDYFNAGSDAALTNTFGANRFALARHGLADKVEQINLAAAKLAREAAGDDRYVLGDIGPSGDFLAPLGQLQPQQLKEAFTVQAQALLEGGVDGFIVETMTAVEEIEIAIEAAKSVTKELLVFASMAFDRAGEDFRTMMGVNINSAVSRILASGIDAVGFNCGRMSLADYIELAQEFASAVKATGADVVLLAQPNAGIPEMADGKTVYKVTPEAFAEAAEKIHATGFNIIGGCCGTSPAHIKASADRLRE